MLLRLGAHAVHVCPGARAVHTQPGPGAVLGAWSGREGGLGRCCGARAAASCDMGLAARMLSSELEMYPMIAVAHEIAMVRTAGSICMARSAPGSLGHRRSRQQAGRARGKLREGEKKSCSSKV